MASGSYGTIGAMSGGATAWALSAIAGETNGGPTAWVRYATTAVMSGAETGSEPGADRMARNAGGTGLALYGAAATNPMAVS